MSNPNPPLDAATLRAVIDAAIWVVDYDRVLAALRAAREGA